MDKRKDKSFRVFLGLLPSRDSVTPTWLPLLSNQIGKTKLVGITRNTGFVKIDCVSVYKVSLPKLPVGSMELSSFRS